MRLACLEDFEKISKFWIWIFFRHLKFNFKFNFSKIDLLKAWLKACCFASKKARNNGKSRLCSVIFWMRRALNLHLISRKPCVFSSSFYAVNCSDNGRVLILSFEQQIPPNNSALSEIDWCLMPPSTTAPRPLHCLSTAIGPLPFQIQIGEGYGRNFSGQSLTPSAP